MTHTGQQIRDGFIDYFAKHKHTIVPSSSLVPTDPTVLLTIAGMLQFKPYFMGLETPEYTRAVSVQKCIRTNDIDNVGRTARHQTFFEMLGNFSFGDYFKDEAIAFAWELLTKVYGIDKNRLYITVFEDDDESIGIWKKVTGFGDSRISKLGEDSNFWAAGPVGPCGPCSEIYYDFGESRGCGKSDCAPGCDCDRFLEIWNLVFMQNERNTEGKLLKLPKNNIDTGSGLERVASVLQNTPSNFETDLLFPIIGTVADKTNIQYGSNLIKDTSLKIIADHLRASVHLIADGVFPSNVDRGYILRRLIRRAIRHMHLLGIRDNYLTQLTPTVLSLFSYQYPYLNDRIIQINEVLNQEETAFRTTLDNGFRILDGILKTGTKAINGADAFKLYDTYGFPLELVEEIAYEKGLSVDKDGFNTEMEKQKENSRASHSDVIISKDYDVLALNPTIFEGYTTTQTESVIKKIYDENKQAVNTLSSGQSGVVVLDRTPFYAQGGGQVGDTGLLTTEDSIVTVTDTLKYDKYYLHKVKVERGSVKLNGEITASIDKARREHIRRHHTSTHILQAVLRQVLGPHIEQAGSFVSDEYFRFDFNHYKAVTLDELRVIEERVNEYILANTKLDVGEMSMAQAKERGALAFFGDKYGSTVRVVEIAGCSVELCGGTHVGSTGDIGLVKIISESSIASGVRRIEGIAGHKLLEYTRGLNSRIDTIANTLGSANADIELAIGKLKDNLKSSEKTVESLNAQLQNSLIESLKSSVIEAKGLKALITKLENKDAKFIMETAQSAIAQKTADIVLLASSIGGNCYFACVIKDGLKEYNAGAYVKEIAQLCGGNGGGKPNQAQAGGKDPSKIAEGLEIIRKKIIG